MYIYIYKHVTERTHESIYIYIYIYRHKFLCIQVNIYTEITALRALNLGDRAWEILHSFRKQSVPNTGTYFLRIRLQITNYCNTSRCDLFK
jgi:hypothetical protein